MTATVKNRGKELFLDIFYDIAGSLFMAIGIFCFMETADIAPGGVSGVSIMIKYLFGVPVGFMSLCINVPLLILALHLVCSYAESRDTKRKNVNPVLRTVMLWFCPAVSLLGGALTLGTGLGYEMHVGTVVPVFVGLLFLILGNYLPKLRRNRTMGIKLPWTLASEENWTRTHRVAGFTWVAAGLLMLLSALLRLHGPTVTVVLLALAVGIPVLFSYLYYRRHEKGGAQ